MVRLEIRFPFVPASPLMGISPTDFLARAQWGTYKVIHPLEIAKAWKPQDCSPSSVTKEKRTYGQYPRFRRKCETVGKISVIKAQLSWASYCDLILLSPPFQILSLFYPLSLWGISLKGYHITYTSLSFWEHCVLHINKWGHSLAMEYCKTELRNERSSLCIDRETSLRYLV